MLYNFLEKLLTIILCLLLMGIAYLIWDANTATNNAQDRRLTLIEQRMKGKARPVITILKGTVYNSAGEVIIERLKK